jgi:hypothetical protein
MDSRGGCCGDDRVLDGPLRALLEGQGTSVAAPIAPYRYSFTFACDRGDLRANNQLCDVQTAAFTELPVCMVAIREHPHLELHIDVRPASGALRQA